MSRKDLAFNVTHYADQCLDTLQYIADDLRMFMSQGTYEFIDGKYKCIINMMCDSVQMTATSIYRIQHLSRELAKESTQ